MTTTSLNPDDVNLNGDVVIDVSKDSLFDIGLNIEDDVRQTEALESVIDDLYYLAESIVGATGINQTFAMEADSLLPGILNAPIGYFTKDLSATRYRVSLENIYNAIKTQFAKICKIMAETVKKFIDWIFGVDEKNATELVETIKNVESAPLLEHKWQALNSEVMNIQKADVVSISTKQPLNIEEIVREYLNGEGQDSDLSFILKVSDPIMLDIINKGEYYGIVKKSKDAVRLVPDFLKHAEKVLSILSETIDHLESDVDLEYLKNIKPQELNTDIPNHKGNYVTFSDVVDNVLDVQRSVMDKPMTDRSISFMKLSDMFINSVKTIKISETLSFVNNAEAHLKLLHESFMKLSDKANKFNDVTDEKILAKIAILKSALQVLKTDVIGCLKYIRIIGQFAGNLKVLVNKLISANQEVLKLVKAKAQTAGSVTETFTHICDEIESEFKLAA